MISVQEAREIIESKSTDWGIEHVDIQDAVGRVLRQDIIADRDFPPFDRVTMDGIALKFTSFSSGLRQFKTSKIQLAGEPPLSLDHDDEAIEIMTGAVLSKGCDMVIKYEDLSWRNEKGQKIVIVNAKEGSQWLNVHKTGTDERAADVLILSGTRISPAEVAIMATTGNTQVAVSKKPKVAIISTGNELVDVGNQPLPHQIRKSNSIFIGATLNQLKIENQLFHFNDDKDELKSNIEKILSEFDVLLLSGGVSKGKADYLPEVLEDLKVNKLFHRVAQRPGKPFWFGESEAGQCVFAFPGNPVSTFMCFHVYFLSWLRRSLGRDQKSSFAKLGEDFEFSPALGYYLQVKTTINERGEVIAMPQMGKGSGDLTNLTKCDAFLLLPANRSVFKKEETFEYYPYCYLN